MRILFFNESSITKGGIDNVIDSELRGLSARSIEVQYVEVRHKELLEKSFFENANIYLNKKKKLRFVENQIELFKPDLLHIHNVYPFFREDIWSAENLIKFKKVFHLHNFYPICLNSFCYINSRICFKCKTNNDFSSAISNKCYDHSSFRTYLTTLNRVKPLQWLNNSMKIDRYIAVSEFLLTKYVEFGFDKSIITKISNGIELNDFVDYDKNGNYVLFLGNVVLAKGVEIVCELAKMNTTIKFIIAGTGRDLEHIKIKYKNLINLEFVGFVENFTKINLIKNSKLLIFPNQSWEAFGLVVLEALKYGKPVITSGIGATSELVIDGVNGIIVNSNDLAEYDKAVNLIWNNQLSFANTTWKIHLEKFNINKHINSLIDLYNGVLNEQS